jgi:hypothetical protein
MKHHFQIAFGLLMPWMAATNAAAQNVYLMDFPESRESVEYAIWAMNERAGFRAEYAGDDALHACLPGIVVRKASEAEWVSAGVPSRIVALATRCPEPVGAYHIVVNPNKEPTRAVILHEMGHVMGCWRHISVSLLDLIMGSRHVMASRTPDWAGLTAEDVDCIRQGGFWPAYQEPDLCFVELTPEFDLIAPDALGGYARMAFAGDVLANDYTWRLDRRVEGGGGDCASVRAVGGQIMLDDVRSQGWSGSAVIAPHGDLWRLVRAVPL